MPAQRERPALPGGCNATCWMQGATCASLSVARSHVSAEPKETRRTCVPSLNHKACRHKYPQTPLLGVGAHETSSIISVADHHTTSPAVIVGPLIPPHPTSRSAPQRQGDAFLATMFPGLTLSPSSYGCLASFCLRSSVSQRRSLKFL